jgi:hypothetical protein
MVHEAEGGGAPASNDGPRPWLKPEATAFPCSRRKSDIAELGLESATVADLWVKAAAKAIV